MRLLAHTAQNIENAIVGDGLRIVARTVKAKRSLFQPEQRSRGSGALEFI